MKIPRRFLSLLFMALVVLSSSVFFNGSASAESLDVGLVSPLRQNEPVLQQVNQIVTEKQTVLNGETDQITQLLQKKDDLSQRLEDEKKAIDDLTQKIADKKAAAIAEQKRLDAIKNMFVHVTSYASGSSGNTYTPGNCTWYVKNKRPDLPNNLGNANTWYAMAQYDGYNTGLTPKKGAVGTTQSGSLGHVVYVEGVSLDGLTVTISEMNYAGLYSVRTREALYTEFRYIYELD